MSSDATDLPSTTPPSGESLQPPLVPLPLPLWDMIKEDWEAHGRDWTKPGFRAIAVHRFGVWRMFISSKVLRAPLSVLYRMLYRKVRNTYGIELPYTTSVGRRVIIEHQGDIVIHGFSTIGDDSIIRQGVTLGNRYLERPYEAPQLGARVNVGAGAKVFGKICLGDGCNIGANAVVLKDVPAGATAVGIPAKVLPSPIPSENQTQPDIGHTDSTQPDATQPNLSSKATSGAE